MREDTEASLIARCRKGDEWAWNTLFDLHYAAAARFILQLSPSFTREDAEEICQETFLAVIKSLTSFHGGSRLQTWIFRIAANKARDYRERQHAAKRGGGQTVISLNEEIGDVSAPLQVPSPLPPPDALLGKAESAAQIGQALDRLEMPCREIIDLRYFADLSYDAIAAELKLNPKTVSSRLSKCLDRFERIVVEMFGASKTEPFSV